MAAPRVHGHISARGMGCCASSPAYDDHATVEERRNAALNAAESRSKANEMRGIKVIETGHADPF